MARDPGTWILVMEFSFLFNVGQRHIFSYLIMLSFCHMKCMISSRCHVKCSISTVKSHVNADNPHSEATFAGTMQSISQTFANLKQEIKNKEETA